MGLRDEEAWLSVAEEVDVVSAEPVALMPQCVECERLWLPADQERWCCYLDDEDNLVFYCPDCAEREFDNA